MSEAGSPARRSPRAQRPTPAPAARVSAANKQQGRPGRPSACLPPAEPTEAKLTNYMETNEPRAVRRRHRIRGATPRGDADSRPREEATRVAPSHPDRAVVRAAAVFSMFMPPNVGVLRAPSALATRVNREVSLFAPRNGLASVLVIVRPRRRLRLLRRTNRGDRQENNHAVRNKLGSSQRYHWRRSSPRKTSGARAASRAPHVARRRCRVRPPRAREPACLGPVPAGSMVAGQPAHKDIGGPQCDGELGF
jgi:hypothetical protein